MERSRENLQTHWLRLQRYPADPARSASESGDFLPYRQYIRLDGEVVVLPERRFASTVLERITERE